jgi:hypothetical protein
MPRSILPPGTMRSGDIHNCTQFDVILEGKARLLTKV